MRWRWPHYPTRVALHISSLIFFCFTLAEILCSDWIIILRSATPSPHWNKLEINCTYQILIFLFILNSTVCNLWLLGHLTVFSINMLKKRKKMNKKVHFIILVCSKLIDFLHSPHSENQKKWQITQTSIIASMSIEHSRTQTWTRAARLRKRAWTPRPRPRRQRTKNFFSSFIFTFSN